MNAASSHATALRLAKRNGIAVTFSRSASSAEDANGRASTGGSTTVEGYAVQDDSNGDPSAYQNLKLVEASAVRLFWVPKTLNECPMVGDDASFESRKVRSVDAYRMGANAEVISAFVVVV